MKNCPNCDVEVLGTIYTNNKGYNAQIRDGVYQCLLSLER